MKWMNSIRGRLAIVSAAVIALVLTIAGLALAILFESYIERRIAQELNSRLLELAGAFDLDEQGEPRITGAPYDPRYRTPYSGSYWYVREGDSYIVRSRSLWDAEIQAPSVVSGHVEEAVGLDNRRLYLLQKQVTFGAPGSERSFVLGVAVERGEVQALASSLGSGIAALLAIIGVVLFCGAWLQATYGLKPLAAIRHQLALLRSGERDRLEGPFPEEIRELAQDLNALFSHQKLMIARGRERAGSLAHGLKTPMTILYGEARKMERAGNHPAAQVITGQLDQIRRQVDRELARARAHGAAAGIGLHADVSATAQRLVELMQRMPRGADIEWRLPAPGLQVAMDADDFGEMLGNILDNARKWAATTVTIDAEDLGDGNVRLSVADDGPGIPEGFLPEAVKRGSTLEAADSPGTGNSGLGLAIVSELLEAYGSRLVLDNGPLGGARATVKLAAARVPAT
jgi:signal transduction histidine kinase